MARTHITHTDDTDEVIVSHRNTAEDYAMLSTEIANRKMRIFLGIEQILWFVVGIAELLLGIELGLKFIGADGHSTFARFMTGVTAPMVSPFVGLSHNPAVGGRVIDVATLVTMVAYLIGASILDRILALILVRPPRTP